MTQTCHHQRGETMPQEYPSPARQCRRHIGPGSQQWCVKPAHHPGAPATCALEYDPTSHAAARVEVARWRQTNILLSETAARTIASQYQATTGPAAAFMTLAASGKVTPGILPALNEAFTQASTTQERDALAALASYALHHGATADQHPGSPDPDVSGAHCTACGTTGELRIHTRGQQPWTVCGRCKTESRSRK